MRPGRLIGKTVLAFAGFMAVFPLLWTALNSLKNNVDIITRVPRLVFTPTLANISYIIGRDSVMTGLYNSVIACGVAVLIGVVLGLPAAYSVARSGPATSSSSCCRCAFCHRWRWPSR